MLETDIQPTGPEYIFPAEVTNIVDGDTFDVRIDLGFEIRTIERVRTRDIDTAEVYGVNKESEQYRQGKTHTEAFREWVETAREQSDADWPFRFYSHEYERGGFGRIIGDVWSVYHEAWVSRYLFNNYEGVELYEG